MYNSIKHRDWLIVSLVSQFGLILDLYTFLTYTLNFNQSNSSSIMGQKSFLDFNIMPFRLIFEIEVFLTSISCWCCLLTIQLPNLMRILKRFNWVSLIILAENIERLNNVTDYGLSSFFNNSCQGIKTRFYACNSYSKGSVLVILIILSIGMFLELLFLK